MRIRDVLIVAVAIICCIIGWSQEGTVQLHRCFKVPISDDETRSFIMAKPIVIDPRGEGKPVLIAATQLGQVQIFDTFYSHRNVEGLFVPLRPRRQLMVHSRVLGFGAGRLSANSSDTVLAVLTDDYLLHVYSSENDYQDKLWEESVSPTSSWANVLHASVIVVPQRAYDGDVGMIAVAVKVLDPQHTELTLVAAFNGNDGEPRWRFLSDASNAMDDVVRETAGENNLLLGDPDDVLAFAGEQGLGGAGGTNGILRTNLTELSSTTRVGEKAWTTFREAVVAALPHHYNHPWDAQLRPHMLYPTKSKNSRQRVRAGTKKTLLFNERLVRMDAADYGVLGEKLNLQDEKKSVKTLSPVSTRHTAAYTKQRRRMKAANAFVYHSKAGIEIFHIFTGNVITSVVPLKAFDTYYHDINDDFHIEAISTQIGPRLNTNGDRVADLMDDCLGMVYTGIPVTQDEVYNTTVCDTKGLFGNLNLIHRFIDGDVRGEGNTPVVNKLELLGSRNIVSHTTRSVMPLVVQVHINQGRGMVEVERYAIYMIDTGLVTCVDPSRRRVLWRAHTNSFFSDMVQTRLAEADVAGLTPEERESTIRPFPHLAAYSLYQHSVEDDPTYIIGRKGRYHRTDPFILAAGESMLSVISTKTGSVIREIPLEEAPVAPVIVTDFNGDGVNDVLIVSQRHIYGFLGSTQASNGTVTSLMILMVALLVLLFAARELSISREDGEEYAVPSAPQEEARRGRAFKRATD